MNNEDKLIYDVIDSLQIADIVDEIDNVDIDDSIFLTNDMLDNIKLKTYRNMEGSFIKINKRKKVYELIAACIAAVVILTGIIGYDKVSAQIQRMLTYIPGIGVYIQDHESSAVYFLDNPIRRDYKGKFIKVTGIIIENGNKSITMEGNISTEPPKMISVEEKNGISYFLNLSDYDISKTTRQWYANYLDYAEYPRAFNIKDFIKPQIKIKEVNINIPFALKKMDNNLGESQIASSIKNDVKLIAIANKDNGIIKISYITPKIGKSVLSSNNSLFPTRALGVVLKDKNNRIYKEINKVFNTLYFDGKNTNNKEFILSIPYLYKFGQYNGPTKFKLLIPENGGLNINKTVHIGDYPVELKSVERINPDYIALTFDTNYDLDKNESVLYFPVWKDIMSTERIEAISKINLSVNEVKGELHKYTNKPYVYLFQSKKIDKSININFNFLKTVFIPIDKEAKFINLDLGDPNTIIKGQWEFKIRLK